MNLATATPDQGADAILPPLADFASLAELAFGLHRPVAALGEPDILRGELLAVGALGE